MNNSNSFPAALIVLFLYPAIMQAETAGVEVYVKAPTPVRHAVHRLSEYTGIPITSGLENERLVRVLLNEWADPAIDRHGYTIRSRDKGIIDIRANDDEGAANGLYTLLRTLMVEHRRDPFSRNWNIKEKPQFTTRGMLVSPYRFGASFGFAELSPDRWSFEDWKRYIDLMRLTNMTTLTMGSERVYHPDYPNSRRDKWRYEVWKQVMDYCHQIGMKFNWFIAPNLVTQQAFWENPDKRARQEAGAWYGNGLSWKKGKDIILKNQEYTLEYFRKMDALEIIFSDGGGFSFDDPEPAHYFVDATNSYRDLMRRVGNDGGFVFWNWVLDFWSKVLLPDDILQEHPAYRTMQDDVIPLLPKDVAWLDASLLTMIQVHSKIIQDRGNPPLRETVLLGKEHGFRSVIDIFWYMNPELSINMFPHPFLGRTIQEARYARDELGVDGVMGYRLAPPCRFINDYVFFRLASDPSLTQEQLVEEVAGLLVEKPENRDPVSNAILALEEFWLSHDLKYLERAEKQLRAVLKTDGSQRLEYVSNGLTFLTYVVRMAQPEVTEQDKQRMIGELYNTVKPMFIFQGLTSDIVWVPEAYRFFSARVEMMIEDYNSRLYRNSPVPEIIDRSIYPRATSQAFKLRWP